MALSATDRGTGGNNTAATTIQISPNADLNVGSMLVLALAYDNAGGGGSDPYSSISDNIGNTWVSRQNRLNDPGAASAGSTLRIFTCNYLGNFPSSSIITVTFGVNVTAKSWTLTEVIPAANFKANYVTGNTASGSSTTPTITTTSITNGNLVFGAVANEGNATITEDSDTSNGSWVPQQTINNGTGLTGMQISSQYKIVTGTATQTYNVTLSASGDWAIGWIEINETVGTVIEDVIGRGIIPFAR